jgi:hypothetical protein
MAEPLPPGIPAQITVQAEGEVIPGPDPALDERQVPGEDPDGDDGGPL